MARPEHVLEVLGPALAGREARVGGPLRMTDQLRDALELVLAHQLHHEPAVGRPERIEDGVPGLVEPVLAQRFEVGDDVGHRHGRVVHRDVDPLALAGRVAVTQRGEDADGGEEAGADVAERADRVRAWHLVADEHVVVDPRHGLDDRGVRRPVRVRRPAGTETRQRRVDDGRVHRGDGVVPEAHAVEGAGFEVLGEHVEVRREREDQVASGDPP